MPDQLLDWILQNVDSFRLSRLPSLYSDLILQRQTNPSGYQFNISTWQTALSQAALAGQLPSSSSAPSFLALRTSPDLLSSLSSRQYGRPLGLAAVIDESVRTGKMIPVSDFLGAQKSIYARGWVPSPWSLLTWGLRAVGLVGQKKWDLNGGLALGELVVVENVERIAGEVMRRQEEKGWGLTERVMSKAAFAQDFGRQVGNSEKTPLSGTDLEVLIKFLERHKGIISYDGKVVKFKPPSATRPEPITHQDLTIVSLKTLISTLTSQCITLSDRISSLSTAASRAVKSANRISALSALRSKKLAESNLKQRADTLSQLEEVYTKIQQAADQVDIIRVMEASADVLKGLNKEVGGTERVEVVTEELRGEMEKVDEVGLVINEPLGAGEQGDENEINDELEAMEREEKEKEAEKARERGEREAEATRKRLEEISKRGDLEELEKRERLQEREEHGRALNNAKAKASETEEQMDASTKRLSQMSIEGEGARRPREVDHAKDSRGIIAEGAS